jgi:hypothetical protein
MIDIPSIKLPINHDPDLQNGQNQCCEVSVPLPKSMVFKLEQLSVLTDLNDKTENPKKVDAICQIVAYWPDNSFKWIKLTYQNINQPHLYLNIEKLQVETTKVPPQNTLDNIDSIENFTFKGGANTLTMSLANNQLGIVDDSGDTVLSVCADDVKLTNSQGQPVKTHFKHAKVVHQSNLKNNTASAVSMVIDGDFSETLVNFQLIIDWLVPFELIKFTLQIHNSNRAMHQGGKWDLGDAGSFNFKALTIELNTAKKSFSEHNTFTDVQNNQSYSADNIVCEQFSSGGLNWQSPVHVNHNNTVDINQNGFVLNVGKSEQTGLRCQPVVTLKNNLAITLNKFWQNFPKSLSVKDNLVSLGLFPATHYLHELQGGEKKSHTFWVSLNSASNDLTTSHKINRGSIAWDWINQCDLYPFIERSQSEPGSIQSTVELGLEQTSGFITKRENVDEYGWRNFGELYADHETAGYQGEDIFVSHYNNQYDPIYGFLRQYLTTGNTQWFELADDLASHVKDIDIYHTSLDKNEYNGGLFWHTDHYLQAFTSSHRSYSKHQASDVYQDHAGGGGPGGQHCYTTGLYLHYCLTGLQSSKDAVLTLSNWITHVYEGSGTCLELLLAFKNRHVAGYKNHFTGQYPLDRGIANYVNALLDSFELTQNEVYIAQVENILSNTVHPNEDLSLRTLDDVESNWFYTVYLQALCKYLLIKLTNKTLDEHFYYNRDCLLNFADWMLTNERPYLEKPEILEYPNDTWTAQDLRKAYVLAAASYFSPKDGSQYMQKAEFFEHYVSDKLHHSETKTYTRILVLLMQNQGATAFFKKQSPKDTFEDRKEWPSSAFQQTSIYTGLVKVMFKRIIKFSPKNEFNWLKKRLE